MTARISPRKTSLKKTQVKKTTLTGRNERSHTAHKSFLHKMLTAEGWKRLIRGKGKKKS
jgi:hypothetical protein